MPRIIKTLDRRTVEVEKAGECVALIIHWKGKMLARLIFETDEVSDLISDLEDAL
jgi:hypothetical protein